MSIFVSQMRSKIIPISFKQVFFLLFYLGIGSFVSLAQKKDFSVQCVAPVVSMSSNVTICNGGSTTLTATAFSGTAPYTFLWSPSASLNDPNISNPVASPTVTSTYTVIVDDQSSGACRDTGYVTVTVNPTPTVIVSGTNTVCSGQSTTLSASGASTYVWAPGGSTTTSIVVTPSVSTNYTVTGTGANTCTATTTYSVTVNPTPTVIVSGTNTICSGQSTTLSASAAGGVSYVWAPGGATTASIVVSPTTSTNYTVTGTNASSCTVTATYSITVNPLPSPTITASPSFTICNGSSTTLTASGTASSSYVWNPGGSTNASISVNPTTSTGYTVTETSLGCSGSSSQTVTVNPLPFANAGTDVSVCAGDNTTLNGTGNGTFSWSPSTGLSCTTCPNPVATPTAPVTYTLSVTNNCGTATDEISITYPGLPSANAGTDKTICIGASTTLTGTGSGTIAWSPSTGLSCTACVSPVANPTVTSTYTFSVTGACGTSTDEVIITVADPVTSVSGNTTICNGEATTLTATGGISYSWSTGASTNPLIDSPANNTTYTVIASDGNGCTDDTTINVVVNPLPASNAGADVSICFGSNTTLNAIGNGAFVWAPSTGLSCTTCSNPTADPTATTTYTVTITNSCGSISDSVIVSVRPLPIASAGADATICIGQSTTLNASGGGTYSWSPSAGLNNTTIANPVASPTVPTDYTVTVTEICGSASDVVSVIVNPLPAAAISGNDTVCAGETDTLFASGGGTYLWNDGSVNDTLIINPTGVTGYTVTVTSAAACTNTATFTVNISTVTASISGTSTTICSGESATLTAAGGGTYSWSTGSSTTTIVVSPTTPTNYTVTATNSLGCTNAATFNVGVTNKPNAVLSASSDTICAGSSTSLTASGGTSYSWSPSTGLSSTIISNPVSTITVNVTYTVVVSTGGCADTASIGIVVNQLPTVVINATATSICIGSCTTLSATGGSSYVWAPGAQTTASINVCTASSGSYTVTTTDANGCRGDANIFITVVPVVNAFITGDTVICAGDATILTAQGGSSYSWNTGDVTSAISVNPAGNSGYTVTVSNGVCSDQAIVNVAVSPLPTVLASAALYTINIGNQTTLTGTTSTGTYNWAPSTGLSCTTCMEPIASPTVTTIYILTTVDSNGCSASDSVIVNVTLECDEVFVPSAFSPNGDGFNDYLYVRNPCVQDMEFSVFNRWGQKVFFTSDITLGWDGTFHGKPVDPAVFFYTLSIKFITGTDKHIDGNVTLVR